MQRKSIYLLTILVAALVSLGVIMLFSTGAFARDSHHNEYYFVKQQLQWLGVGLIACIVAARVDYHYLQRWWWVIFGVAALLLACCYVPHIGLRLNGSSRWIGFHSIRLQPSELGKFAAVVFLAMWCARFEAQTRQFWKGFALPLAIVGFLMMLIAGEVDLGTTALIGCTAVGMLFLAGVNPLFLGAPLLAGLGGLAFVIYKMPERMGRIMAFMDPEKYPKDAYQTLQGLIAMGSGGTNGVGLGMGRQKMAYLPYAHTDFIFPVIGEELGVYATLFVVLAFFTIAMCGFSIAARARDRFGMLLGFGIVIMLTLQAAINIGVTTSLLPNKGMPLPLISYGGSNLLFCLTGVGILINIYRQGVVNKRVANVEVRLAARTNKRNTPRL